MKLITQPCDHSAPNVVRRRGDGMGRKTRQKYAPERREGSALTSVLSRSKALPERRLKHRWLARVIAIVVVPLLIFGVIEGALRLCGYGYSTKFFVPAGDGKSITTNPKFAWQYYPKKSATSPAPVLFAKEKPAGTRRVFILGESAAAGTPDPAFGFWRMLSLMLREQYPGNHIEIINAAMRGIDSHIIRTIASECAQFGPDLFIVYAGNNELIGLHSPSPGEFTLTSNIHWLRFKHALNRLKLMQLGHSWLANIAKKEAPQQDQEFFRRQRLAFDDDLRNAVYQNYEINLRDICGYAERAGAQTLLCTVAVNLRDFPPLASLHRKGLSAGEFAEWDKLYAEGSAAESSGNHAAALVKFEEAARIDNHFAELLFRMARCYEALAHLEEARRCYALARDWDAIQFRTDSRMNAIVRSVATNGGLHVQFLDLEQRLANGPLAESALPGRRIFQEHVHFTFAGDYQVAALLAPAVVEAFKLPAPSKALQSLDECARALAYTVIDDFNVKSGAHRMLNNPPFLDQLGHAARQLKAAHELQERAKTLGQPETEEALAVYRAAIALRPEDWMLKFNFANLLSQLNQPAAAVPYFAEVVERLPQQQKFRVVLGNALLQAGRASDASEHFEAALRIDPEFKAAKDGLALAANRR
ncbi:MAG TPA: tetratricopeptide repeat protein [Methylomirabilota bacterium]|nr:tetratricopeptide repeat protein [Methylomirabilota bacterium]